MLEDALRKVFSRRAEDPLAVGDAATAAIRRARAAQRRRVAGGLAAGMAAAIVFTTGLVYVQQWRVSQSAPAEYGLAGLDEPAPVAPTTPAVHTAPAMVVVPKQVDPPLPMGIAAQVDLYAAGRLWTSSGERLSIPEGVATTRLYRVPAGWLVGGDTTVQLLRADGTSVPLPLTGHWVVSPDGTRVAYPDGPSTIRFGTLDRDGVRLVTSAAVAVGTVPVTFAGDRLVLALRDKDGIVRQVDHWVVSAPYRPTWTVGRIDVYDGGASALLAQERDETTGNACLVRLAAPAGTGRGAGEGLRVDGGSACGLGLSAASSISPDGHWLATPVGSVVSFYDLSTTFSNPLPAAVCGVPEASSIVWEDSTGLVAGNGDTLVRCRPDGLVEQVPLPVGLPEGWKLVPTRTGS